MLKITSLCFQILASILETILQYSQQSIYILMEMVFIGLIVKWLPNEASNNNEGYNFWLLYNMMFALSSVTF